MPGTLCLHRRPDGHRLSIDVQHTAGSDGVVTTGRHDRSPRPSRRHGPDHDRRRRRHAATSWSTPSTPTNAGVYGHRGEASATARYRLRARVRRRPGRPPTSPSANSDGSPLLDGATTTAGQDAEITVGADTIDLARPTRSPASCRAWTSRSRAGTPSGHDGRRHRRPRHRRRAGVPQGLVDAANDDPQPRSTSSPRTTRPPSVRTARRRLQRCADLRTRCSTRSPGPRDGTSLAGLGVQTDRYGKITFDAAKFADAPTPPTRPASPPDARRRRAPTPVPGFAARLEAVGKQRQRLHHGALTLSIKGRQSSVDDHAGQHRRLGRPAGHAPGRAEPAVLRPRGRARQDAEPGVLAGRPDRLAADVRAARQERSHDEPPHATPTSAA